MDNQQLLLLYQTIFEQSFDGIVLSNANNVILNVNPAFCEITGYSRAEIIGKSPNFLSSGKHDADFYHKMWHDLQEKGVWFGEIWNRRKNGECYPEWLKIAAVHNDQGEITHYIGIFTDISEVKETAARVTHLTNYDTLTNIPNRTLMQTLTTSAMKEADSLQEIVAIIFLDIDKFKRVNDIVGHTGGDELLCEVANRLLGSVRRQDTVSRLGGDEFVIIMTGLKQRDEIHAVLRRVMMRLNKAFRIRRHEISITASLGISFYPFDGKDVHTLMRNADIAMHYAKENGGNHYDIFTVEMNNQIMEQLLLESNLRNALHNQECFLVYQPQVSIMTGKIIGVEALLRWKHPHLGLVPPSKFIPIAEESGIIISIGEWVFRTACREMKQLYDRFGQYLEVAINLSAVQFRQLNLLEMIQTILWETQFPPEFIKVELTESMVMEDVEQTITTLRALKAMNIKISIDDFGTGYSSLNYLKRFPIDQLKIDQSFVREIREIDQEEVISEAIIALAHSMHLIVIAEGVETPEQLAFLRKRHCDEIQGYLYSRPLCYDDLVEFMHKPPYLSY